MKKNSTAALRWVCPTVSLTSPIPFGAVNPGETGGMCNGGVAVVLSETVGGGTNKAMHQKP